MKKLLITVTSGLAFLLTPTEARACAYDSAGPVFVTSSHPDWPLSTFAAGRLGVVHGSMRTAYLAFAYRTMMGIPTTPEEQQPLVTRWELMHQALPEHLSLTPGFQRWLAARKQVAPQLPEASPEHSRQVKYAQVPRIQGDAFQRAANTATDLAQTWKKHPALVEEWVRNQDTVFGPCASLPEPDPRLDEGVSAQHQARRRDERAYQEAASRFYCNDYPGALSSFQKLAASQESPYRALAAYLVARTHVRQALMEKKGEYYFESREDAVFLSRLSEADRVLDGVLASPELRSVHAPARGLRSLVRYRLRPKTWHCELLSHVLEPGTGTALASELGDLDLMLREASTCEGLPAPAEALQAWLHAMKDTPYSAAPDAERRAQYDGALARWKKTAHIPWLVAALSKATPDAPGVPELLAASAKVAPTSPAGLMVAYHAARLLHGRGEVEAARARLATVPAELTRDLPSTDNLLREERLAVARDLDEAMREAFNIIADYEMTSSYSEPYTTPLAERPRFFSPRAVAMLEPRLTAKRMGELAAGDILPPALRRQLMWTAFARATVAGDDATIQAVAKRLAETEPKAKAELLALVGKPTPEERQFEAQLLLMGLPVVSARLYPGQDRLANTHPNLSLTMDISYQRNWWCGPKPDASVPSVHFEDTPDAPDAAREWKALQDAGNSVPYFARVATAWAQAHPEDPRSPIALFRAVRASKRGCGQATREARDAFRYLHKHYGKTSWAKRTPYVY
ncbi:hypothetical protein JKA73_36240 [Myxococcus xanthus]|uniref:hypothetical protein n=1 Tax=Myxococcus xanthus TaxID=34 RepID=UPI00191705BC|nr:hypothetical protein [Myxococcus xanthus]QQR44360.1 hypothetical protein JKA73_36240 [Myxococcus xanthus]